MHVIEQISLYSLIYEIINERFSDLLIDLIFGKKPNCLNAPLHQEMEINTRL